MFKSSSIGEHLIRGCIGFILLSLSIYLFTLEPLWGALLGIISAILALFVLRGCPACWLIGLITSISNSNKVCIPCTKKDKSTQRIQNEHSLEE